jgi:pyrroline-5-carboxylate reductase
MNTSELRVGFVGGGRVARILVGGWCAGSTLPTVLQVHEPADGAYEQLRQVSTAVTRAPIADVAAADVVFLALHPPALLEVLPVVSASLNPAAMVVSLAPRIPLNVLTAGLGTGNVARMIPNAPSMIGKGYNPVCFAERTDAASRTRLLQLASAWGEAPEVPERDLEAYAVLTGMGPTYFWFQWEVLRQLGAEFGLASDVADRAIHHMIAGASATLLESGLAARAVMDLVPVRPLDGIEADVIAAYNDRLRALHARIRPAIV